MASVNSSSKCGDNGPEICRLRLALFTAKDCARALAEALRGKGRVGRMTGWEERRARGI